ncbi:uncharacterized protein LOC111447507 [Cucurbita moschata]|uniref:Uncharacterized protein LOC111447507 n=1 Tax=Cucurbita moschata TaxID=3662 RepID=A0A6J1FNZ9_CUCMO|nr:uncharacterized protein LOC111447507 [Cucurbita moschata]
MAPPSHRSSSPSMVAGRASPNSRNSEIVNPTRRSFSSEPRSLNFNTPTNSPSDYPRRNSTSRENLFYSRDNEEKENGKNQSPKPVRIRSPAAGKSTKHFMSPTISAASKISVSPKKKILGDRNELVRSSLSFSGLKSSSLNSVNPNPEASAALESDTNQEIAPISNPKKSTYRYDTEVAPVAVETDTKSETAPISKSTIAAAPLRASKTVKSGGLDVISDSHSNSEVVTMAVETDAKLEITRISNSAIAALPPKASEAVEFADVEVSSDPNNDSESPAKTVDLNSSFKDSLVSSSMEIAPLDADPLMPRPYDPKTNYLSPRPQFLHYKPRRINQLELDGKLEELFSSESEFSEGTDSEDPQMESDEASSNESHMKEEEREEGEEEEEVIVNVSEQSPVEAKTSSKLHFSRIFKISSLLLILLTACFSICVVNVHDLERASLWLPMEDSTEVFEFAKTNFNVLVRKFEVWHASSRPYISDMVFNIGGRRPLIYLNQTGFLHKDVNSEEQCLVLSHQTSWEEENDLNVMEEARKEGEIDIVEEHIVRGDHNEEEEELLLEEIEAMKEREIVIEHVEGEVQNEEESFQEIEADANDSKDGEEENGQASANSASEEPLQETEEGSLQEIIEETSTKSASDKLNEEDEIQEKQTEENYEDSSSPDFIHDQIEQEAATGGETKEEQQNDSIQQRNAEIQRQSPPVSPPSAPQSDAEDENDSNIDLVGTATNNRISRDFSQNTAVIASAILLGLSMIIPAGLIYARKSGSKTSSMAAIAEAQEEPPLLKEKKTYQSPAVPEEEEAINDDDREDIARKGFCSSETSSFLQYSSMKEEEKAINDDDREDIAIKGFCSSEMSSFLQYSSMKEEDETETSKILIEAQNHSHGRKTRKNSRTPMASSSLDEFSVSTSSASPSYGSFTTYEKIPIKHGNEEEEIVTPVRRSSRIRKTAAHRQSFAE